MRQTKAPGAIIGILGGGQLGRMLVLAAAELGYSCHVYSADADAPAFQVCARRTVAAYDDQTALRAFASSVDVATFEFENIPAEPLRNMSAQVLLSPSIEALRISQDRLLEKEFIQAQGARAAPYVDITTEAQARATTKTLASGGILKTRRNGYDGKGQIRLEQNASADTLLAAWHQLGAVPCVLEGIIPFVKEISVIVARGYDGTVQTYVPVENRHKNHILDVTIAPAAVPDQTAKDAEAIAERLAAALNLVGILTVEMFVLSDGTLVVNELAPRVHNSGHWTIDACLTNQFEQHIRAICGLPLGATTRKANAVMKNLIGDDAESWLALLSDPANHLHLYGKKESRPGRKMGHVTKLYALDQQPYV